MSTALYCLNVGQANCLVLLVPSPGGKPGDRAAVVIDVGADGAELARWLRSVGVRHLPLVLMTHNDRDHIFGLDALVQGFRKQVGTVGFVVDRHPDDIPYWFPAQEWVRNKVVERVEEIRAPAGAAEPRGRLLYEEPISGCWLYCVYPTVFENQAAVAGAKTVGPKPRKGHNATSAVFGLSTSEKPRKWRVLFGGDLDLPGWHSLAVPCGGSLKTPRSRWTSRRFVHSVARFPARVFRCRANAWPETVRGDMADEINPTPPPREPWWAPRLDRVLSFVGWALAVTLTAYISTRAPTVVVPPAPVAPVEGGEPGKLYVGGAGGEVHPAFGWVDKPDDVKAVVAAAGIPDFADTPAGKAVQGDEDRFLWQAVRKVNDRGPPWYPDVNQQSVGCCVGCGYKHSVDVCQAIQILSGRAAEWKPVAVEVIYGGSRVEVGGGQIGGDGSVGAWAAKWCRDYGVVPMAKYAGADLTEFSPARARQFGSRGVPADIEAEARKFPVKSTALVKTWEDVKRAVAQGYPVAVCSNQGFTMTRDAAGFARPSGQWAHCMAIIGVRGGDRPGAFVLNSWGDQAHTGPVWPADMPVAGFWADAATIDRMVRQGDSFALSDMVGFPSRNPDDWWFIRAEPRNPVRLWADDRYALAP